MPLISTYASASNRGYASNSIKNLSYYFNALNLKGNNAPPNITNNNFLSIVNSQLYQYGTSGGSTASNRGYSIGFDNTGAANSYKIYSDINYYFVTGMVYDSLGNQHILQKYYTSFNACEFRLIKYNSTGTVVYAKSYTFASSGSDNSSFGMVIDSSDNLYIGSIYANGSTSATIAVTKIDCSTYTIQWCNIATNLNSNITVENSLIKIDNAGNIFVTASDYVYGVSKRVWIYKFISNGSISWIRRFIYSYSSSGPVRLAIDSSNNLYVSYNAQIVQINNTGSALSTLSTSPSGGTPDTYDADIFVNSSDNLIIARGSSVGLFISSLTTAGILNSVTQITLSNLYTPTRIVCDSLYTYVLNEYNNGSMRLTTSILKLSAEGDKPISSNYVSFTQTKDNGSSYSWSGTLQISAWTGVASADPAPSYDVIIPVSSAFTLSVANITQSLGSTTPDVYNIRLS